MTFAPLPDGKFGAIYADPPWHFQAWAGARKSGAGIACRATKPAYTTLIDEDIAAIPVSSISADNCVLFLWTCWPMLRRTFPILDAWGFDYKTCAFAWMKANAMQVELFEPTIKADMNLGYWTRANSEVCLLATRGKPKRLNADVRQGIIEPKRQHSRKPDCVYGRIERLVAGPYLELFARTTRPGWTSWGNQVGKFAEVA